jgi:cardiolipin synthase
MFIFSLEELTLIGLFLAALEITGVIAAVHAILNARTSQGAIAWALSLVTAPYLALPLYAFLGRRKHERYYYPEQCDKTSIQETISQLKTQWIPFHNELIDRPTFGRFMEKISGMMFTGGNSVDLLVNGKKTFESIFAAIDQAKDYVLVEFFIVHNDELGRELQQRLLDRQRAGVQVYFLYDSIGSYALPRSYRQKLIAAGAIVHSFGSPNRFRNRFQLNFRNHRKIVVTDGQTGFAGGHNVGNEYLGGSKRFGFWRDTHLKLTGPAVMGLQIAFLESWLWVTGDIPKLNWTPKPTTSDTNVLIVPSGPADELETCSLFFVQMLNEAKERAWITSPYFVPNEAVLETLVLAALRGVDVRVMIPENPDKRTVWYAAFAYMKDAQTAGVKFYRYHKGFLHQKVMLVDDNLAVVGTANLDNRSFRLNFELSILVSNRPFAIQVGQMLTADFGECHLVTREETTKQSLPAQIAIAGSRLLSPIL